MLNIRDNFNKGEVFVTELRARKRVIQLEIVAECDITPSQLDAEFRSYVGDHILIKCS